MTTSFATIQNTLGLVAVLCGMDPVPQRGVTSHR